MKISVELSDLELKDVIQFTGEKQKGPAIRKLVIDALMLRRRAAVTEKFMRGEWSVDFPVYEKLRALDRKNAWQRYRDIDLGRLFPAENAGGGEGANQALDPAAGSCAV